MINGLLYKQLLQTEQDFQRFVEGSCIGKVTDKPEQYPCVVVYHNYEDYNARDWTDMEFVYLEDFDHSNQLPLDT